MAIESDGRELLIFEPKAALSLGKSLYAVLDFLKHGRCQTAELLCKLKIAQIGEPGIALKLYPCNRGSRNRKAFAPHGLGAIFPRLIEQTKTIRIPSAVFDQAILIQV